MEKYELKREHYEALTDEQRELVDRNEVARNLVAELFILAETDEHGLQNGRALTLTLDRLVRSYDEKLNGREEKRTFTVAEIDLSGFKSVNDKYGDSAGDYVIRQVPVKLGKYLRESDLFHPHGDTFYVLMKTDEEGARKALDRLKGELEFDIPGEYTLSGNIEMVSVGLHIGFAEYQPGESLEDLRKRANMELVKGKEKNREEKDDR